MHLNDLFIASESVLFVKIVMIIFFDSEFLDFLCVRRCLYRRCELSEWECKDQMDVKNTQN